MLFVSTSIIAQVNVGVKGGIHFADANVSGISDGILPAQNSFASFSVGTFAEVPLKNGFSFMPELNYTRKGFMVEEGFDFDILGVNIPVGAKAVTKVNYVESPLLLKYTVGNQKAKAYVIAGPSFGYASSAEVQAMATFIIDFNIGTMDVDLGGDMYNRWEVSGIIGLGGELPTSNGKFIADIRYSKGLSDVLADPIIDLNIKNQGVTMNVGYAMSF